MEGYFLIHRKMFENPLLNIKPICKGYAWIKILGYTNHKEGFIKTKNGKLIKIERGECGWSQKALADDFGWGRKKIMGFLEHLKNQNMVHLKKVEDRVIIQIINYETYQVAHQKDKKTNIKRHTKRTQTNNDNKDNSTICNINLSSSSLSKEDEEILKNLSKRNKIKYFRPWLRKITANGDYIELLSKEKERLQAIEEKKAKEQEEKAKEDIPPTDAEEEKRIVEACMKRIRAKKK